MATGEAARSSLRRRTVPAGGPEPSRLPRRYYGMDPLDDTVRSILALAASYKLGTIIKAERVVDEYLDAFQGYQARRGAMGALLNELALPEHHAATGAVCSS